MTSKITLAVAVAAMLTVGLIGAGAEVGVYGPQAGNWEFTIAGSGSSNNDIDRGSGGFSGALGYFLNDAVSLGLRQSANFIGATDSSWDASTLAVLDLHANLDRLRPFVGLGAGYAYGIDFRNTGVGEFEGGLKWYVKEATFLYGMMQYEWFFRHGNGVTDNFDDGRFVYSLGVGFNF